MQLGVRGGDPAAQVQQLRVRTGVRRRRGGRGDQYASHRPSPAMDRPCRCRRPAGAAPPCRPGNAVPRPRSRASRGRRRIGKGPAPSARPDRRRRWPAGRSRCPQGSADSAARPRRRPDHRPRTPAAKAAPARLRRNQVAAVHAPAQGEVCVVQDTFWVEIPLTAVPMTASTIVEGTELLQQVRRGDVQQRQRRPPGGRSRRSHRALRADRGRLGRSLTGTNTTSATAPAGRRGHSRARCSRGRVAAPARRGREFKQPDAVHREPGQRVLYRAGYLQGRVLRRGEIFRQPPATDRRQLSAPPPTGRCRRIASPGQRPSRQARPRKAHRVAALRGAAARSAVTLNSSPTRAVDDALPAEQTCGARPELTA